jgi:hypothetical protein
VALTRIAYSTTKNYSKHSTNHPGKVCLPPLHIKLGIINISSREWILHEIYGFENTFPKIKDTKIKERLYVGPKIGELIQGVKFGYQLSEVKKQH